MMVFYKQLSPPLAFSPFNTKHLIVGTIFYKQGCKFISKILNDRTKAGCKISVPHQIGTEVQCVLSFSLPVGLEIHMGKYG